MVFSFNNASSQGTGFAFNATGATGPANFSFPVSPGVNMQFEAAVNLTGGTGGSRIGLSAPSGAQVYAQVYGVSTGTNAINAQLSSPTFVPQVFCVGVVGPVFMAGTVIAATGVTGTAQIVVGNMAATGPTGMVGTGSYFATRGIV